MMFLLRMLTRRKGGAPMDPLQVSMTGVRMGEKFLQIGCNDRTLLAGLASKVGLSGTSAVGGYNESQLKLAQSIGAKIGALIETENIDEGRAWPFADGQFDMVVVDDTGDEFRSLDRKADILRNAHRALRGGGRIEFVARLESPYDKVDVSQLLSAAGFKPVRVLAERNGLRFVEGLRTSA